MPYKYGLTAGFFRDIISQVCVSALPLAADKVENLL